MTRMEERAAERGLHRRPRPGDLGNRGATGRGPSGAAQDTTRSAMPFRDWAYMSDGKPGRCRVQQLNLRADLWSEVIR